MPRLSHLSAHIDQLVGVVELLQPMVTEHAEYAVVSNVASYQCIDLLDRPGRGLLDIDHRYASIAERLADFLGQGSNIDSGVTVDRDDGNLCPGPGCAGHLGPDGGA